MAKVKVADRLAAAMGTHESMDFVKLWPLVFPEDEFPGSHRANRNGGPPIGVWHMINACKNHGYTITEERSPVRNRREKTVWNKNIGKQSI